MGGRGSSSSLLSGLNKTLLKLENGRVDLKYEMASIVSRDGRVLKTYIGDNTSIDLTKYIRKNKELYEGTILTHNHPEDYNMISYNDIEVLGRTNLKEMRASDNHYTYSLAKGDGRYNNRFYKKYKDAWEKTKNKLMKMKEKDSSIDYDKVFDEYQHKWLQRNAKKNGYIYKRIKR